MKVLVVTVPADAADLAGAGLGSLAALAALYAPAPASGLLLMSALGLTAALVAVVELRSARVPVLAASGLAVIAGLLYSALQYFGTGIVREITNNASDTYGQFALVLGLVTWLGLLSIAALMSTEFNAALVRHREGSLDRLQPADADETAARPEPATT